MYIKQVLFRRLLKLSWGEVWGGAFSHTTKAFTEMQ